MAGTTETREGAERHPFVRVAYLLRDWWPNALLAFGSLLLAVAGFSNSQGKITGLPGHPTRWIVFAIAGAIWLVGGAALALRQRQLSSLERKLAAMEAHAAGQTEAISGLARVEIELLARELGYASNERISLLAISGVEAVLVARFSDCPPFQTRGRGRYPLNEGVLADAYETGVGAVLDLPDPAASLRGWRSELRWRCRIPADTANALTMRSRTAIAIRIRQSGVGGDPLGFVVFESTRAAADVPEPCVLDPNRLKELLAGQHGARFQGLLDVVCRLRVAA